MCSLGRERQARTGLRQLLRCLLKQSIDLSDQGHAGVHIRAAAQCAANRARGELLRRWNVWGDGLTVFSTLANNNASCGYPSYNATMDTLDPPRAQVLGADAVRTTIEVLRAIDADRSHLTQLSQEQRRELLTLAGLVAKPERHDLVKMAKAFRRADRTAARERDAQILQRTGLRVQRRATRYTPLWLPQPPAGDSSQAQPALGKSRNCRCASSSFYPHAPLLRFHVPGNAAIWNYSKREQTADLSGRYALITGARVKIGFQAGLKLLRAGAHVIVTTRFAADAAQRYGLEPDYPQFKHRLQIHGVDLRHSPSVELFARGMLSSNRRDSTMY